MSVLKGLIQLDMLPGTYPSIIVSEGYTEAQYNTLSYPLEYVPLKTTYTNVFTYLMLYYPGFRNGIEYILNNSEERYTATLYGYKPDSKISFTFFYSGNRMYCDVDWDGATKGIMTPRLDMGAGSVQRFKDYFFTQNKGEIYIGLTQPYNIKEQNRIFIFSGFYRGTYDQKTVYSVTTAGGMANINDTFAILNDWFHVPATEPQPDTPVGAPTGNNTDTEIDIPGLPSVSILNGLHHMYCPDSANVKKMGRALWSPNFFDNVVKIFANPVEAIVSLSLSPIKPTVSENPYNIVVGNIELQTTTGVETSNVVAPILTSQYGTYSFGDLPLYEKYSSYLDYNTTVQIYLPFIGVRDLSVNDVMGKVLSLTYNVDFFTGDFIAVLKCKDPYGTLKSVLYHWNGNILSHLPISSSDFSNGILSGLSTSLSIATGLAVGGPGGAVTAVGGSLGSLGGFKPAVDKGGSTSSNVGMLDSFNAYLIVTKPIEDKPKEYNTIKGGTVNKNIKLTQGLGYVVCGELHLENIGNATSEEKDEIERLLKSGVIL